MGELAARLRERAAGVGLAVHCWAFAMVIVTLCRT